MSAPSTESTAQTATPTGDDTSRAPILKYVLYGLIAIAAIALLVWGGKQATPYVKQFTQWVDSLGPWGPVAFILSYAIATVAFVPGLILTMAGGALFGLLWGTAYVLVGATIGACAAFLIARYVARGQIEKKLEDKPRFQQIDLAIGREGGKIAALLRLSPVFPFNLQNYALGLTNIKFIHYFWACFAMIPGTFLYVYIGKTTGDLAAALAGERDKSIEEWIFYGVGLLATFLVAWIITKKAKQALSEETPLEVEENE